MSSFIFMKYFVVYNVANIKPLSEYVLLYVVQKFSKPIAFNPILTHQGGSDCVWFEAQ